MPIVYSYLCTEVFVHNIPYDILEFLSGTVAYISAFICAYFGHFLKKSFGSFQVWRCLQIDFQYFLFGTPCIFYISMF